MGDLATLRKRHSKNFTVLGNAVLRDARLSWKARGLFSYLWSHSENYHFSVDRLTEKAKDGRDSTSSGLAELQSHGYLVIERERGSHGRYVRTIWTLSDEPAESVSGPTLPPHPENPSEVIDHERETGIPVKPSRKEEELSSIKTTTTTGSTCRPNPSADRTRPPSVVVAAEIHGQNSAVTPLAVPRSLSASEGQEALAIVVRSLGISELAQQVLDEMDARNAAGRIENDWRCYLRALIRTAEQGEFQFSAGRQIQRDRTRRTQAEAESTKRLLDINRQSTPRDPVKVAQTLEKAWTALNGAQSWQRREASLQTRLPELEAGSEAHAKGAPR